MPWDSDLDAEARFSGLSRPWGSSGFFWRPVDPDRVLAPLISQLEAYDALRLRLEYRGGSLPDLQKVTDILRSDIQLEGRNGSTRINLMKTMVLPGQIQDAAGYDLHFEVRRIDSGMPVYYLCRIRQDYWSEYGVIVEDLYRSPGYPVADERFMKLMSAGHEMHFLCLSRFRDQVGRMVTPAPDPDARRRVDKVLYDVGRHVFQSAWHEDQIIGFGISRRFGLTHFPEAVELLYLCLSGELCELRAAVEGAMVAFFEIVYPRKAIVRFLNMLPVLHGGELTDLPPRARRLYLDLSAEFSRVMKTEVTWGSRKLKQPLYKIILGNFSRLDAADETLKKDPAVIQASKRLERESLRVIRAILDPSEKEAAGREASGT